MRTAKRKGSPKRILRLPHLDNTKRSLLDSLGSPDSVRAYTFAIDDFIGCYCSEPRLAFSKHGVLRYRLHLESRNLSAWTINLRLAAVRQLAFEAADGGLLSPELAAGIQRVKGAKKVGVRLGNWLTVEHCKALLNSPDTTPPERTLRVRRLRIFRSGDWSKGTPPVNWPQAPSPPGRSPAFPPAPFDAPASTPTDRAPPK